VPFPDDRSARWAAIAADWDQSEEIIKQAELVNEQAVVPAIKELRYAGRRLVDALNASAEGKDDAEIDRYLDDARFNCFRARHDAIDAALAKVAIDVENASSRLGYGSVLKALPNFAQFTAQLIEARNLTASSRKLRNGRDELYKSIAAIQFIEILEQYATFKTSLPMMKKMAAEERRNMYIGYAIGVAGVILAALALIK
jgi:hypothetical protein